MPDDVPEEVKVERLNRRIALQNELSAASNRRDIGREFDVLGEGVARRGADRVIGRTEGGKACVLPREGVRPGDVVRVRVTDATSATLICERDL